MTPTHEQIEAAAEIICRGRCDCRLADLPAKKPPFSGVDTADDFRAIAKLALTAAAEVGDTQERLLRHGREVFDATIERCAQVAANFDDGNPVAVEIAAAIRALKKG